MSLETESGQLDREASNALNRMGQCCGPFDISIPSVAELWQNYRVGSCFIGLYLRLTPLQVIEIEQMKADRDL
jgi:hypothetical protein